MQLPRRIASLLPSATEILWALGLQDRVVAVSHECDYPLATRERPAVTRSLIDPSWPSGRIDDEVRWRLSADQPLYELDEHLLQRLAPDLIITQAQCVVCAIRLEDVTRFVHGMPEQAGTAILTLQPSGLEDILGDIDQIGRATGAVAAANELAGRLQVRIDSVRAAGQSLANQRPPRVVCIEWIKPVMTAGNWVPRLVELAGGCCLLATEGQHSGYVTWEAIGDANPDVIVVAPCGFDLPRTIVEAEALRELPEWNELAAVKNGRVWAVDGNAYFNRSGPRIVDSLEILAHILRPERFALPGGAAVRKVP